MSQTLPEGGVNSFASNVWLIQHFPPFLLSDCVRVIFHPHVRASRCDAPSRYSTVLRCLELFLRFDRITLLVISNPVPDKFDSVQMGFDQDWFCALEVLGVWVSHTSSLFYSLPAVEPDLYKSVIHLVLCVKPQQDSPNQEVWNTSCLRGLYLDCINSTCSSGVNPGLSPGV